MCKAGWEFGGPDYSSGNVQFVTDSVNGGITINIINNVVSEAYAAIIIPIGKISGNHIFSTNVLKIAGSYSLQLRLFTNDGSGYSFGYTNITADGRAYIKRDIPVSQGAATLCRITIPSGALAGSSFRITLAQIEESLPGQTAPSPWRPGGTGKAIMIEEGTINLVSASTMKFEQFVGAGGAALTLTQNQSVPEWGATDATRLQTTGGTTTRKVAVTILSPSASGQSYTASVWIKNQSAVQVQIGINLGVYGTIQPGESKRVTVTGAGDGVSNVRFDFMTPNTTDNLDVIAWHPQIEAKAYATSWTDGTRANEDLIIPCNGIVNADEGTIEMWGMRKAPWHSYGMLLGEVSASVNNGFSIIFNSAGYINANFNGSTVTAYTSALPQDQFVYYVLKWSRKDNSIKLFENGVSKSTNTFIEPKFPQKLRIGSTGTSSGAYFADFIFDNIRISNVARTDAEILAAYNANAPLTADQYTTALLDFDDSLEIKNGLIIPDRFQAARTIVM
jgi:hypothetical protein